MNDFDHLPRTPLVSRINRRFHSQSQLVKRALIVLVIVIVLLLISAAGVTIFVTRYYRRQNIAESTATLVTADKPGTWLMSASQVCWPMKKSLRLQKELQTFIKLHDFLFKFEDRISEWSVVITHHIPIPEKYRFRWTVQYLSFTTIISLAFPYLSTTRTTASFCNASRIPIYKKTGTIVAGGTEGTGLEEMKAPFGIAMDSKRNLYACGITSVPCKKKIK